MYTSYHARLNAVKAEFERILASFHPECDREPQSQPHQEPQFGPWGSPEPSRMLAYRLIRERFRRDRDPGFS